MGKIWSPSLEILGSSFPYRGDTKAGGTQLIQPLMCFTIRRYGSNCIHQHGPTFICRFRPNPICWLYEWLFDGTFGEERMINSLGCGELSPTDLWSYGTRWRKHPSRQASTISYVIELHWGWCLEYQTPTIHGKVDSFLSKGLIGCVNPTRGIVWVTFPNTRGEFWIILVGHQSPFHGSPVFPFCWTNLFYVIFTPK